jgi:chromosome segregation ATPase
LDRQKPADLVGNSSNVMLPVIHEPPPNQSSKTTFQDQGRQPFQYPIQHRGQQPFQHSIVPMQQQSRDPGPQYPPPPPQQQQQYNQQGRCHHNQHGNQQLRYPGVQEEQRLSGRGKGSPSYVARLTSQVKQLEEQLLRERKQMFREREQMFREREQMFRERQQMSSERLRYWSLPQVQQPPQQSKIEQQQQHYEAEIQRLRQYYTALLQQKDQEINSLKADVQRGEQNLSEAGGMVKQIIEKADKLSAALAAIQQENEQLRQQLRQSSAPAQPEGDRIPATSPKPTSYNDRNAEDDFDYSVHNSAPGSG